MIIKLYNIFNKDGHCEYKAYVVPQTTISPTIFITSINICLLESLI